MNADRARKLNDNSFGHLIPRLAKAIRKQGSSAEGFIGYVLQSWCDAQFAGLPPHRLRGAKTFANCAEVNRFVELLKGEEFVHATYWLSSAYARLTDESIRQSMAMFFTPPGLTCRLLDDLEAAGVDFATQRICDPACGGAAFLAPVALRMKRGLAERGDTSKKIVAHVASHVYGAEKDRVLCELSRHFLLMALYPEILRVDSVPQLSVCHVDSLTGLTDQFGSMDVVVCNPPYRKMSAEEASAQKTAFEDVIEAQPNLYALFVALSVKLLKPGGRCALLTPTSFLSGQYFSKLRLFLQSQSAIEQIGVIGSRCAFPGVLQQTAITLMSRNRLGGKRDGPSRVIGIARSGEIEEIGRSLLPGAGQAWPIPQLPSDVALIERMAGSPYRLRDYGYTATVGAYVWNRDTRPKYQCTAELAKSRTKTAVPLLWSSDIATDGQLRFSGRRKSNDEPRFVDMGSLPHPCVISREGLLLQRVTGNHQTRRLIAATIPASLVQKYGGFVGENHTVILERTEEVEPFTPEIMVKLLTSHPIERYFRCLSSATNVSVFELRQLPLPDPNLIRKHVVAGRSMEEAISLAMQKTRVPLAA